MYISMLRGINVGGHNMMKMEDLREACTTAGLRNVRTHLQSGNIVFEHDGMDTPEVGVLLRRTIALRFGFDVALVVRTGEDLREAVEEVPFRTRDLPYAHITFLERRPSTFPTEDVDRAAGNGEQYSFRGQEVYLLCPNGYGRTRLSNSFFERKLGVSATTRNWATVNALVSMADGRPQGLTPP